jgi:hypothetical protein
MSRSIPYNDDGTVLSASLKNDFYLQNNVTVKYLLANGSLDQNSNTTSNNAEGF